MKFKKLIMPLIAIMMLGACQPKADSSNNNLSSSGEPTSSINNSSSEDPFKDVESLHTGSVGGSLVELSVGEHLQVNQTYTCSFVPADVESKKMRAVYDESMIEFAFVANSETNFTIKALKAGAFVLKLYAEEIESIVYREVIRIDEMIKRDEIENYLFNVADSWKTSPLTLGLAGQFKLVFTLDNPLTLVMTGGDELEEKTRAVITLEYKSLRKNYDFMFYVFKATLDTERSSTNRKFDEVLVTCTGNSIYMYDNEGLINIFYKA